MSAIMRRRSGLTAAVVSVMDGLPIRGWMPTPESSHQETIPAKRVTKARDSGFVQSRLWVHDLHKISMLSYGRQYGIPRMANNLGWVFCSWRAYRYAKIDNKRRPSGFPEYVYSGKRELFQV